MNDRSLASEDGWVGMWVRHRDGPTRQGRTITVGTWHRVGAIEHGFDRTYLAPMCRPRPHTIGKIEWPGGIGRLEVSETDHVPGAICPRCRSASVTPDPEEADQIETLADLVTERILARIDAGRT